jgi:hypothetical protein
MFFDVYARWIDGADEGAKALIDPDLHQDRHKIPRRT